MSRRTAALDTQQLLLFEAPTPLAEKPPAVAPPMAHTAPAVPLTEPASIASVLAPAVFRHPLADREIRLHEHVVAYALKRARRRSIGFIVGPEGLSVNAPKWVGLHDIEVALQEKASWILRKLREQQERAQRLQAAKVDWRDGTTIPFLGETVTLVLDHDMDAALVRPIVRGDAGVDYFGQIGQAHLFERARRFDEAEMHRLDPEAYIKP